MRLFIALLFKEDVKEKIGMLRDVVADRSVKGRFAATENFHLTLAFIGESTVEEADRLLDVLGALEASGTGVPESLIGSYVGSFQRRDREIVWLGIEKDKQLKALYRKLVQLLTEAGFKTEDRRFSPHITIGRQVLLEEELSSLVIQPIELKIRKLALMESKQVDGVLRYVEY